MRNTIHRALYEWGHHTPLTFTEVSVIEDADIKISFQKGKHSDLYPFDGEGGTLAHAFYPSDGRVHLDIEEKWNDENYLFRVLVHEFGHMLGLGHTPNMTLVDIMYHIYLDFINGVGPDDIAGIQFLYGIKPSTPTSTPTKPTSTPTSTPTKPTKPTSTPTKPTSTPTKPTSTPTKPTKPTSTPTSTPTKPTSTPTKPTSTPTKPTKPTKPTSTPIKPTSTPIKPTSTPTKPTKRYYLKNNIININSTSPIIFILSGGILNLH
jgi:hypothetical protein